MSFLKMRKFSTVENFRIFSSRNGNEKFSTIGTILSQKVPIFHKIWLSSQNRKRFAFHKLTPNLFSWKKNLAEFSTISTEIAVEDVDKSFKIPFPVETGRCCR